jgi:hypothetical protein
VKIPKQLKNKEKSRERDENSYQTENSKEKLSQLMQKEIKLNGYNNKVKLIKIKS